MPSGPGPVLSRLSSIINEGGDVIIDDNKKGSDVSWIGDSDEFPDDKTDDAAGDDNDDKDDSSSSQLSSDDNLIVSSDVLAPLFLSNFIISAFETQLVLFCKISKAVRPS